MRVQKSYLPISDGEGDHSRSEWWWGILRRFNDHCPKKARAPTTTSQAFGLRAVPLPNKLGRYVRLLLVTLFAFTQIAAAVLPGEAMPDPRQDQRARDLYSEVRCVVCQNESIADSSADIAADMRRDIRLHIADGLTDTQIRDTMRARYGDYVLFRPRFAPGTALLWGLPLVILLTGGLVFALMNKKPEKTVVSELTPEEQARLDRLLNDDNGSQS
ncbi:cytochrome c-type biogenesis protein CcmH [Asticcacaulis sp. BYS171W]|uniref:Cytochrome c-type biogenesis protein n=1 Tax=Asticcacaulis aquaticus TaxID=2984212 RepID=A0ABT5HUY7_9CAUL|nr:cytochrome c-type biogenesis protein [Asticcacaulis aquaticus]MDC7683660.1 cytochrome c-type biogenesis protein CcmH [Asticcacaulis aquaticus]